jgi:Mg-chelatase subunit ChlD
MLAPLLLGLAVWIGGPEAWAQTPEKEEGAARVRAKQPFEAKGLAAVGLTPEAVNQAIDRGAAGLWRLIRDDLSASGRQFGQDRPEVLAALALVHAGAHQRLPDFHAQLRRWLAEFSPGNIKQIYDIGLLLMTIESYGDPSFYPLLRQCARWILENQGPKGCWTYGTALDPSRDPGAGVDRAVLKVAGGRPLDGTRPADEVLARLGLIPDPIDGDNSVTQYAVLGLHAASRAGIKVPAEVWKKVLAETLARQVATDGGWAYDTGSHPYGSMTCAGICTIALARHEAGEPDPADHPAIERGLAWLARNFAVDKNPEHEHEWLYYYLYSLERVGRILDTEFIGPHEWYPLGARFLVQNQRADGTWADKQGQEVDPRLGTSFALLFLTRATASLAPEVKSGPGTLVTGAVAPRSGRLYIILDCSGSMLEEMGGRKKFEIAREAVISLARDLPDDTELGLRLYGHRLRAIDDGASEDSSLVVPMARLDRAGFDAILEGARARGKTPLALSLEQAARDIGDQPDDRPVTAVLLTDGGEDTQPRRDPVKAAAGFAGLRNVRLKIVGFDINRPDWQAQLGAMAAAAGAQYLPAARADELIRELKAAVFGIPEAYVLLDQNRTEVARGRFGDSRELPPGKYRLRTAFAGRDLEEDLWINSGTTTAVTFDAANLAASRKDGSPARVEEGKARPDGGAAPEVPAAKPRFCTGCGARLGPAAKFCTGCGARTGG